MISTRCKGQAGVPGARQSGGCRARTASAVQRTRVRRHQGRRQAFTLAPCCQPRCSFFQLSCHARWLLCANRCFDRYRETVIERELERTVRHSELIEPCMWQSPTLPVTTVTKTQRHAHHDCGTCTTNDGTHTMH